MKILIADDDPDVADMLGASLRDAGHEVDVAYGGTAALERARMWVPDVCILDIDMPELDGIAAAQALRAQRPDLQIVALTGRNDRLARLQAEQAGFDLFLTKDYPTPEVIAMVNALDPGRFKERLFASKLRLSPPP